MRKLKVNFIIVFVLDIHAQPLLIAMHNLLHDMKLDGTLPVFVATNFEFDAILLNTPICSVTASIQMDYNIKYNTNLHRFGVVRSFVIN